MPVTYTGMSLSYLEDEGRFLLPVQDAVTRRWPSVPSLDDQDGFDLSTGRTARLVHREFMLQTRLREALAAGAPPVMACLHPAALGVPLFCAAWRQLVREGQGTVAWAVEWMLAQATSAQRAALTRADYEACLTAPAADVRLLGQSFVSETYTLPPRHLLTTGERLKARLVAAGRAACGQRASAVRWALPPEPSREDMVPRTRRA